MTELEQAYTSRAYLVLGIDPIHVGSGEHKLAIVDNAVIRDTGTNLPKIPATTLGGGLRSYTALYHTNQYLQSGSGRPPENCAEDRSLAHCGKTTCPVCMTYGFTNEKTGLKLTSMAQIFDAHLAFFPVHSMVGPVWVTSQGCLNGLIEAELLTETDLNIKLTPDSNHLQTVLKKEKLTLGWFLLEVKEKSSPLTSAGIEKLKQLNLPDTIINNVVLVSDKLFSHVVNSNLEVRTSTAIDPVTGSSKEGALFTYEAVPRSVVFWFNVIFKDPRNFKYHLGQIDLNLNDVIQNVENGLRYIEYLGVGGMVTRGMGRLKTLNLV